MPWALDPQEILQIAQEAVRQDGYVTYLNYEDALRQAICYMSGEGRLKAVDAGHELRNIREVLLANGYQTQRVGRGRVRYYPPGTAELPNLGGD